MDKKTKKSITIVLLLLFLYGSITLTISMIQQVF